LQLIEELVERTRRFANFVFRQHIETDVQVAATARDFDHLAAHLMQTAQHAAEHEPHEECGDSGSHQKGEQQAE